MRFEASSLSFLVVLVTSPFAVYDLSAQYLTGVHDESLNAAIQQLELLCHLLLDCNVHRHSLLDSVRGLLTLACLPMALMHLIACRSVLIAHAK